MKSLSVFFNLALWLIAIFTTLFMIRDTGLFTYLGPLYFICMLGSTIVVRNAKNNRV